MQDAFTGPGMLLSWEFPLDPSKVTAAAAQGLDNALNRATTTPPALTGPLVPSADTLTVTSPLISDLSLFLGTQAAIQTVLLLLFVSLIVVGAAVILLAARMIVARRDVELTMLRARGGSLRQVAALLARAAVLAAGPAAVLGAGLAIAPGPRRRRVVLGRPVRLAAGRDRGPGRAGLQAAVRAIPQARAGQQPGPGHQRRELPAAVGRGAARSPRSAPSPPFGRRLRGAAQPGRSASGSASGGGVDLYLTLTPVLVAIPVVVVMLRLYPLAVGGLLAASARGADDTGFVALSRAVRSSLLKSRPRSGSCSRSALRPPWPGWSANGITQGEIAASWHTTGADVLVGHRRRAGTGQFRRGGGIAAVHGVRHAAPSTGTRAGSRRSASRSRSSRWTRPATRPWSPTRRFPPWRRRKSAPQQAASCPLTPRCRCWPRHPPPPSSAQARRS